ncbi:MAG: hypothetical protein AAB556_01595 [Patescibacteria group bacterium]
MKNGFIQIIIILALLVIILSLLGVSLSALFSNPILQDNFSFIKDWGRLLWNSYLGAPARYIYKLFLEIAWNPSLEILRGVIGGENNITDVFKK